MKITVQIVNYNSKKHLRECLGSLRKCYSGRVDFEVLLVNNDSENIRGLAEEKHFPFPVRVLEIGENVGFARAHNRAAKDATGEYLLFLNPDTIILPGFLENMAYTFETNKKIGIVGSLLVGENGLVNEEHCGTARTPLSIFTRKFGKQMTLQENDGITEVDWVSGGAMMIKKKLFFDLGCFDENYFMYFEDVDLCLTAKKRGHSIVVNPKAKIVHKSGKSFKSQKAKKRFYYTSQNYYLRKNFGMLADIFVRILRFPLYLKNVYFG